MRIAVVTGASSGIGREFVYAIDKREALDEIELEDKSETRILIEKFVDENPEAVALLLRNWINEDWGGA